MKKRYFALATIGIFLLTGFVTNPSLEQHKEEVKNKLNRYMQQSLQKGLDESDTEWDKAGQALGLALGGTFISGMVDNLISRENYLLFSVTKVTWEGEVHSIGIGVFGNVFISGRIDELLDEDFLEK